ncbi:uncharacterized protein LOC106168430 [Lingula anatina]|uniref:Uncharacterized protein LOC106168430 n=1 Tax=Lingula anatina TaxID=7574 RepID=A0A1S3IXJ0_LINAN|nr:uncharacterized protein LOC106168430 [Lingula anatina]|eukprot:XP_013402922.1 uncharacterized protein LOC106168430 [Lingula anatina]
MLCPKKKTILLIKAGCAVVVLYTIMRYSLNAVLPKQHQTIHIPSQEVVNHEIPSVRKIVAGNSQVGCPSRAPPPWYGGNQMDPSVRCQRIPPAPNSCQLAEKLFKGKTVDTCDHQTEYVFCKIKKISVEDYHVKCSGSEIKKTCVGDIQLGVINEKTGETKWTDYTSTGSLEEALAKLIHPSSPKRHFGLCFLRCILKRQQGQEAMGKDMSISKDSFFLDYATQLLLLPPQLKTQSSSQLLQSQSQNNHINFNLIFIDSVSHPHFQRSMPKTIEALSKIHHRKEKKMFVFEYELFQAIRSRTYETIQALFSGEADVDKKPFAVLDMPPKPLKYQELFGPLRKHGYSTLFLEDLCWIREWGVGKDLLVYNESLSRQDMWRKLLEALDKAAIDGFDITYASCPILEFYGEKDPFFHLPVVCYNGRHHHQYILDYLTEFQNLHTVIQKPYATFATTNVGHDEYGTRIQTLDPDLAKYVEVVSSQENTITVLFSDHGNAYGRFVEQSIEGRLEVYHPFLYILIPEPVASQLGPKAVKNLKINQQRLVSIFDVHYMLRSLLPKKTPPSPQATALAKLFNIPPRGLLDIVSANRTCDDIPRLPPSLCICEGYETMVSNDTYHALVAEFALGQLNNLITDQFHNVDLAAKSGYGTCRRLVATRFENVKEMRKMGTNGVYTVTTKFDLYVTSFDKYQHRKEKPYTEDIFFITVNSYLGKTTKLVLRNYERITSYSKYGECADQGVSLKLCICDTEKTERDFNFNRPVNWVDELPQLRMLNAKTSIFVPAESEDGNCLKVFLRRHGNGASFEIANVCLSKQVEVKMDFVMKNMDASSPLPAECVLYPGQIKFVVTVTQKVEHLKWEWNFNLSMKTSEVDTV